MQIPIQSFYFPFGTSNDASIVAEMLRDKNIILPSVFNMKNQLCSTTQ